MKSLSFVLPVLLAVACTEIAGPAQDGLTLSLALTATRLQPGQADTIAVTITNTNTHSVSLSAGGCPIVYYVADVQGNTVVPPGGGWVCVAVVTQLTLAAGERQARTFVLEANALAPGLYSVYGSFSASAIHLETPRASVQVN